MLSGAGFDFTWAVLKGYAISSAVSGMLYTDVPVASSFLAKGSLRKKNHTN